MELLIPVVPERKQIQLRLFQASTNENKALKEEVFQTDMKVV